MFASNHPIGLLINIPEFGLALHPMTSHSQLCCELSLLIVFESSYVTTASKPTFRSFESESIFILLLREVDSGEYCMKADESV